MKKRQLISRINVKQVDLFLEVIINYFILCILIKIGYIKV